MNEKTSVKHSLISKNNTRMFIMLAVAGALLSFTAVAGVTLVKRMNYQTKVINARVKADNQLKNNISAVDSLVESYKQFDQTTESVIGTADPNSKIILDALPSKYDFPALATSLERLMVTVGLTGISITGSDNEASAQQNSASPSPVEIPFTISATGSYSAIQSLISKLQGSIRPFKISKLDINTGSSNMSFTISAVTYYQPEKNLDIPLQEVK